MAIKSPTKRPYVITDIEGHGIKLLYDTGSDISCINSESLFWLNPSAKVTKLTSVKNFQAAGGQKLRVTGKINLACTIDNRTVSHEFFVIENLNEKGILGMDFISKHQLHQDPSNNCFFWKNKWQYGKIRCLKDIKLEPLSTHQVKVRLETADGTIPAANCTIMGHISHEEHPLISGNSCLLETNDKNTCTILVQNCAPFPINIRHNDVLGQIENAQHDIKIPLDNNFIDSISQKHSMTSCKTTDKTFLQENANLKVPKEHLTQYQKLLENCHEVFSRNKGDLGRSNLVEHDISLKTREPVYVKQFKIPEAHMKEVEVHLKEWLKLGVVEPCRSKYNSPIFVVPKKDGTLRVVQDFRALNAQTHVDKYSMHDVTECVNQIGRAGSTIFSTIDLTSGFWQMALDPKSQTYTAFTIPGYLQMKWTVAPMGLLGSPASFQRLVEKALEGIPNVIVYIDDLIIHTKTHHEHLKVLHQVFMRLFKNNLKINLKKCVFGSPEVSYLGFRLTPDGIKPGTDKLKAVGQCKPPSPVKEVRQFLGLCNFFRAHVKNFAIVSAPLANLTKKGIKWKRGDLPEDALTSFRELQTILCSEPVMSYPRRDRQYCLITDASVGDEKHPGGLGAILTQLDENQEHKVIAYASRKLQKHEKNYTPFLLEMQASIWGMEHFFAYLKGRHFILFTDHKPLEKLGTVHTKTLNRLQEMMNSYDFTIQYKKGSEMPADFLSRNVVASISWDSLNLAQEQSKDFMISQIKDFLLNRKIPADMKFWNTIKFLALDCFVDDDVVWRRLKRQNEPSRVVLFVPNTMREEILREAHGHLLSGHDGLFKTKERILQSYYWPGMDKDIASHIQQCHKCQLRKKTSVPQTNLQSLPQCTEPNQRIHADLFGPLIASGNNKKFILCITDAFTKYAELIPLPDKEALTVASAIFSRWICRFGSPLMITTDGGKEFTAHLSNALFSQMHITHLTTSPYHPQCNSQAEVMNKTIAKYLSSFVNESTLDWELYLAPMMFSYNTSIHSSTHFSPAYLTFGHEPRHPLFPSTDLQRKFYGEQDVDDFQRRLLVARQTAAANNEASRNLYEHQYNKQVKPTSFHIGQKVLLGDTTALHKNRKLSPKFSGPHIISRLIHDTNAEIIMAHNNRRVVVHLNRLKPYFYSLPSAPIPSQEDDSTPVPVNTPVTAAPRHTKRAVDSTPVPVDLSDGADFPDFNPLSVFHQENSVSKPSVSTARPRGRPPKQKFLVNGGEAAPKVTTQTFPSEEISQNLISTDQPVNEFRRITRSMVAQNGSQIDAIVETHGLHKHKKDNNARKRLHKKNFNQTGDIFGNLLQCNGTFGAQPHPPGHPQNDEVVVSSSDESDEDEFGTGESASDDEEVSEEEAEVNHPEELLPPVHQQEPQAQPRHLFPLPPRQLPNILQTGPRHGPPNTRDKPDGKGNNSKETVHKYPASTSQAPDETKPSIPKLPSTGRMPSRVQPQTPDTLPSSYIHPRGATSQEITGKRHHEAEGGMAEGGQNTGARPKAPAPVSSTRPNTQGTQKSHPSDVSETKDQTLQETSSMGKSTDDLATLDHLLMEVVSLRDRQADPKELQSAANNLGRFIATSQSCYNLEFVRSTFGIEPDAVIQAIFKKAHDYRKRLADPDKSTQSGLSTPHESTRPLRSNTKAPDLPPITPFSLEHQLRQLEKKSKEKKEKK